MRTKEKSVNVRKIIRCYWETVRRYRRFVVLTFVGAGTGGVLSHAAMPVVYRDIIDIVSWAGDRTEVAGQLMVSFGWLALVVFLHQVFFRLGDYSIVYVESNVMKDLSDRTFSTIERHSYRFFSDNFTGGLVAKARRFVRTFENLFDALVFTVWTSLLNMVGIFGVLFWTVPLIAWMLLAWAVAYSSIVWFLMRRKSVYDSVSAEWDSKVSARLSDNISSMLVIKMFAWGKEEKTVFEQVTCDEERARRISWNFQNLAFATQGILMAILELGGMYAALRLWLSGTISTGTVVLVQVYIVNIMGIFWQLGRISGKITRTLADAEEMVEIFESKADVNDVAQPQPFLVTSGEICFDEVDFAYPDGSEAFRDFSLTIEAGEKVGLVGASGSGKSTLTKLLLRFYDPQSGAIRIDEQNIRNVRQDDLRRSIAYVPQEPALFHRSLRENIAYGKPDATDEELVEAARKAHAHDFISKLEKGYDTLVGERGVKLSGGERQRVALARAILKSAPILVLDEATSALDTVSEKLIQDALDELMRDRTVIVIAHRLSTVRKMDRIVVLDDGHIVEEGTHDMLVARKGAYADLWNHQTDGFID